MRQVLQMMLHAATATPGNVPVPVALLPDMSSTNGVDVLGVAFTAYSSSNYAASFAFWQCVSDKAANTDWATAGQLTNYWGGIVSASPFTATAVRFRGRVNNVEHPVHWRVEVSSDSNNGADGTWTTALDKTAGAGAPLVANLGVQEFALNAPTLCKAIRIFALDAGSGSLNPGLNVFQVLGYR